MIGNVNNRKAKFIEKATRTKNCHVCGDEGHLCDNCRESFLKYYEREVQV